MTEEPRRRLRSLPPKTLAAVTCAGLVLATGVACGLYAWGLSYSLEQEIWLLRATGYMALGALFVSLSVTPAARLGSYLRRLRGHGAVSLVRWQAFRRAFGITAALCAGVHGAWAFATYLGESWTPIVTLPYLRAGLVALAILGVLLLTSFPQLLALLRVRLWKELHRLAYVAAFFVFQHLLLSPFAPRRLTLVLFAGLLLFGLLRWLPKGAKGPAPALKETRGEPSPVPR